MAAPAQFGSDAERAWYAVVGCLGYVYYSHQAHACAVLRRPTLVTAHALRQASRLARPACCALLAVALAIAADVPAGCASATPPRVAFAALVAVADVWFFASHYCHPGFVLLYSTAAMVLAPGPRTAVLRLVAAHQLGSSGVMKLRVAGLRGFTRPSSMYRWLRGQSALLPARTGATRLLPTDAGAAVCA